MCVCVPSNQHAVAKRRTIRVEVRKVLHLRHDVDIAQNQSVRLPSPSNSSYDVNHNAHGQEGANIQGDTKLAFYQQDEGNEDPPAQKPGAVLHLRVVVQHRAPLIHDQGLAHEEAGGGELLECIARLPTQPTNSHYMSVPAFSQKEPSNQRNSQNACSPS
jgi:hypothetical protein